jgi:hypothetical protein
MPASPTIDAMPPTASVASSAARGTTRCCRARRLDATCLRGAEAAPACVLADSACIASFGRDETLAAGLFETCLRRVAASEKEESF